MKRDRQPGKVLVCGSNEAEKSTLTYATREEDAFH